MPVDDKESLPSCFLVDIKLFKAILPELSSSYHGNNLLG